MATLKLKKPAAKKTAGTDRGRPPIRGAGSAPKKRPTLAEAQAEREAREASFQARGRWEENDTRRDDDAFRPAPGAPRGRPRPEPGHVPQGDRRDTRSPRRDEAPADRRRNDNATFDDRQRGGNTAFSKPPRDTGARNTAFGSRNEPSARPPRRPDEPWQDTRRPPRPNDRDDTRRDPRRVAQEDPRPPRGQARPPARGFGPADAPRGPRDARDSREPWDHGAPSGRPSRSAESRALPPARPVSRGPQDPHAPRPDKARARPRPRIDDDEDDDLPMHAEQPGSVRLSKRMSELGIASRREADEWIPKGWVRVDGKPVTELGSRVMPGQLISIEAKARDAQAMKVTVLLNKPVGYVSGQAEDGYEPASVLVTAENQWREDRSGIRHLRTHLRGLAPAGRLDIDSVGLLVLTQDGRIAKQLIGEDSEVEKEYLVRVEPTGEPLSDEGLALLNHGLELDGEPLRPAKVEWLNDDQLRFVLREGKKRQIRRMCEAVGLKVVGLKRVRIGQVVLGDLPPGQWRYLRGGESFV